ncbi:MAG: MG2 domain-containing protein [Cyclobacteriaceae bacterium]|nr:MG2 domain-containing protein [Cyclobacteriaceae bacterium]
MKSLTRLLLATLVFVLACQPSSDPTDFSSPKSLFVDQITSHTAGVISITSPVKLKLAKNWGDSLTGKTIEKSIFKFSPSIEGKTFWQDNRTIVFEPVKNLVSGQAYQGTVNLKALFPSNSGEKEKFKFEFQTLVQNFEVKTSGIQFYSKKDLTKVKIEGQLQTADFAVFDDIKKMVSAKQGGKELTISWNGSPAINQYSFVIENIVRAESPTPTYLQIIGKPIGLSSSEEIKIDIPSLSDYKVVSSQIKRGKENYISVLFSDPLNEKQNLNGLVQFTNLSSRPRTVINLNELKIYPTSTIEDEADLVINKAIKNTAGYKLKEDYEATLQFTQSKPEVKLVDTGNKAIMPNSKGLVLPFEAVGLNAVDVTVVKIYETNILQYLQVNSLGGDYQMRRVGKPIVQKTIPLNTSGVTDLNSWNTFTLDLEEIISTEPGAIYQIKIGFKKKHSIFFCANTEDEEEIEDLPDDWGAQDETSYWDSYEYYYDSNYDWEQRDNPCSSSYYGNRRSVSKTLFASDLGIIAKNIEGGSVHVFITNLLNTNPIEGVTVQVYDYQQQLIAETKTDGEGKAELIPDGTPFVVVAKKDRQSGYLKMDDGSSLSLSNFDVSGANIKNGLKGFLYGERGVWRPADTVHIGFILEDLANEVPQKHPVVLELYNPTGQLTSRKVSSNAIGNMYRFDFVTAVDAPTGNWQAKAKVGGATFTKTVKIETIKPNRLKVKLGFDKEKFTANDRYVDGDLNVRWLTGANAGNLKAEYEMMMTPVATKFKKYPNYSFDDESKDFYSDRTMVYQGRLNADGYTKVAFDLGNIDNAPGALNVKLFGKVYEEGGDFSISSVTVPYYPFENFVGVKVPEGDKRGILLTDEDHDIRIATVDSEGNPVSRSNIRVELYKLDWKWWWDNSYDNISSYVGNSYRESISSGTISTRNGEGTWKLRVDYPEWGRYYVKVTDPNSGHSSGSVLYLDWPGWAGKAKRGDLDGAAMLDFAIEKEEYKVGEQITMSIPTTEGNRLLVSLESGSNVLETFWVKTEEGNTNVTFEATSEMAPNVYANLTMIQPHGQEKNDLPIRLYGVQSIKVIDASTVLKPVIKMPNELRPEQKFTIEVSESTGKEMSYTIAMVDEGLLDITNYKTPDPWLSFFRREALGVKTWDVYDDVMGAFSGEMKHLLAIGGDGELEAKEQKEANRFKPVVKFLGPFNLKSGNSQKHTIVMPQYIGSVKTMVIASTKGAFGMADKVTPVKQPLMILATLPRVAGPGEQMKLPVNVFALADNVKNVSLTVETSGGLVIKGKKSKSISFSKAGDQVVYFDLSTKAALGIGKVKVTAKSGKLEASYDIELNVIPRNPAITKIDDKVVNTKESWAIDYKPVGILGQNSASIEISTMPSLNIEQRLGYLIRYPHGCIEQTASAVFAQLYLNKLMSLPEDKQKQVQTNVEAGITRLKSFQLSSGGFSYWPGNTYANNWGSNYAGHFLVEAKKAGYAVSEGMLSNWISYQKQRANSWNKSNSDNNNDLIQSYRLYTLALAGSPAKGAMNRLREDEKISRSAKWRLASAYAVAGMDKQAEKLIIGLSEVETQPNTNYRNTFGSSTRDQAMILETLLELNQKEKAFELLMEIAKKMGDKNTWMSTQTTAYSFIAVAKYAEQFKLDEATNVTVNIAGNNSTVTGTDFVNQVHITNADKTASISILNNGEAPVFARIISSGTPIEGNEEAITRNINLKVMYKDMKGNTIDVSKLSQGSNFKAVVSISNPGQKGVYNELALTQIFPSGWEIINTRLDGSETASTEVSYMDIRDDRVMHYFDLDPNQAKTFTVLLNASYKGKFYLPSISVGAMYDNSIFSNKIGRWVDVIGE